MLGAGLLAKKAVEAGLTRKPWVKTSLAPGSKVVTEYLERAGLIEPLSTARLQPRRLRLHDLHRELRAAAGGDLEGDRGARPRRSLGAVGQPQLRGPHPPRGEDELPRLAAAVRRLRAGRPDGPRPARTSRSRATSYLRDLWPSRAGGQRGDRAGDRVGHVPQELRRGVRGRRELERARGARGRPLRLGRRTRPTCAGRRTSRACPPRRPRASSRSRGARVLAVLGDSVTTDHISPAGAIKKDSPAGEYLIEHGVEPKRLQLLRLAARQPRGDDARHLRQRPPAQPARAGHRGRLHQEGRRGDDDLRGRDGVRRRGRAAVRARRQGVRLGLVARLGGQGPAAARRALRDRRVLRAHPPLEPGRHGRPPAAVPGRRVGRVARADRRGDVRPRRRSRTARGR